MKRESRAILLSKAVVRCFLNLTPMGRRYYAARKRRQKAEALANLQRFGGEILDKVHRLFMANGIKYMVSFGTLLGCVRDGGIMAHDDDVDFAILPGTMSPKRVVELLEKCGFEFYWAWKCEGRITEFAVTYNNIHIDFYLFKDCGNHYESHWYMPIKGVVYPDKFTWSTMVVSLPVVTKIKEFFVRKYGIKVMIPDNYDEVLTASYGLWRIPDPNWKSEVAESDNHRFIKENGRQVSRSELI